MRWLSFTRTRPPVPARISDDELDALLARYVVDVPESTVEAICSTLARLPLQTPSDAVRARRTERRAAPIPLLWPGVGLAFGMLLLGLVVGSNGMPASLLPDGNGIDISDLALGQGS